MSAKKTAKKKPAAKKAAKKAAKVMADVMDAIIETVSVSEPSSVHEVFDEDDYNPYAPEGMGGGWVKEEPAFSSLDDDEPYPEPESIIMPPDRPQPQPVPVEKPPLPSPAPVGRVAAPPVAPSPTGDALVVQRLVNAINYLYPIARLTKGQKGPQPADIRKVQENIVLARNLITRLS